MKSFQDYDLLLSTRPMFHCGSIKRCWQLASHDVKIRPPLECVSTGLEIPGNDTSPVKLNMQLFDKRAIF